MLTDPNVAMEDLSAEKHLTTAEKQILESIAKDPSSHQDLMIEHGYTGIIDTDHVSDIVGTVTVSIITRRQVFLAEFARGLELFGLMNAMKANAEVFKPLFVRDPSDTDAVDANYVVSFKTTVLTRRGKPQVAGRSDDRSFPRFSDRS